MTCWIDSANRTPKRKHARDRKEKYTSLQQIEGDHQFSLIRRCFERYGVISRLSFFSLQCCLVLPPQDTNRSDTRAETQQRAKRSRFQLKTPVIFRTFPSEFLRFSRSDIYPKASTCVPQHFAASYLHNPTSQAAGTTRNNIEISQKKISPLSSTSSPPSFSISLRTLFAYIFPSSLVLPT